ncbi:MAG: metallophosphoesterase [Cryobacterium sp.]|nr:metallophosphoesterase [Oligoflexia bacterium]
MKWIIPTVLGAVLLDVYFRFLKFFLPLHLSLEAVPFPFTILAFISLFYLFFVRWLSDESTVSRWDIRTEKAGHLAMGYVSFLLVYLAIRDVSLLFLSTSASESLHTSQANFLIFLLAIASLLLGFLIARSGPVVRKVSVAIDSPVRFSKPLRIIQVSDLHVGSWIGKSYVEDVAKKIRSIGEIDLLILTGDIGDGDPGFHREALESFKSLSAARGKFSVTGNHEGYWSESEWNRVIEGLGFKILSNESAVALSADKDVEIRIAGIADARPDIQNAIRNLSPESLNILLAHQPKHADLAAKSVSESGAKVHLQLSGHTHNGQFFPWNLVIGFFQKYPRGLYAVDGMKLYVNVGTGFWGAPIRLGTRSEITLIELNSSA